MLMDSLISPDTFHLAVGFLVPGVIITFIRAQFTTGRVQSQAESVLSYVALSLVYYAVALPVSQFAINGKWQFVSGELAAGGGAWICLTLIGPVLFGVILGLNVRMDWTRRILGRLRLNIVHAVPTAWDWKFSCPSAQWVLVTCKDGTKVAGLFASNSFVSTDQNERDIYIERVYDVDEQNQWQDVGERGILILGSEISSVNFWPYKEVTA
jgi:hypothetical protein